MGWKLLLDYTGKNVTCYLSVKKTHLYKKNYFRYELTKCDDVSSLWSYTPLLCSRLISLCTSKHITSPLCNSSDSIFLFSPLSPDAGHQSLQTNVGATPAPGECQPGSCQLLIKLLLDSFFIKYNYHTVLNFLTK